VTRLDGILTSVLDAVGILAVAVGLVMAGLMWDWHELAISVGGVVVMAGAWLWSTEPEGDEGT
jgi:hypothetical protein